MLTHHQLLPPAVPGDARVHQAGHLRHQAQRRDVSALARHIQGRLPDTAAEPYSARIGSVYIPEARTLHQPAHVY